LFALASLNFFSICSFISINSAFSNKFASPALQRKHFSEASLQAKKSPASGAKKLKTIQFQLGVTNKQKLDCILVYCPAFAKLVYPT